MKQSAVCALAFLLTVVAVAAPARAGVSCGPDTAFENERVRIWFQGFKGNIQVWNKSQGSEESEAGKYQYKTSAIVEHDGESEVARMNLNAAFPKSSECSVEETDETVTLTLKVTDDVGPPGQSLGEASVTFVYHFQKSDNGAKFDLLVEDWPWQSEVSELAFDFQVTVSEDQTLEPAENGIGIRDPSGEPVGMISWGPEATARYEDGSEQTAAVVANTDTSEASTAKVDLRFTGVTAGYDELDYDPWVGIGRYLILGGLVLLDDSLIPQSLRDMLAPVLSLLF